jgi:hypothetical protein
MNMLKTLVTQHTANYFKGEQWETLMKTLGRGKEVRHAHVYTESILHPYDFAKVIQGYLEKHGFTLQRKITFLSHGTGYGNIYYIHPRADMAHFEVFLNYNDDAIIEPAGTGKTRAGVNFEYWDDAFMNDYHAQFAFRKPNRAEEEEIVRFFESDHWKQAYDFMTVSGIHSHVPVETGIHPDSLLEIGTRVLESRRWNVGRAVSVVYNLKGYNQGKVSYLLKQPEIVLELDWEFNPNTVIKPRGSTLMHAMTDENVKRDLDGIPYYRLDARDIEAIISMI